MGLSYRVFLLDDGDAIYRMPAAKFDKMLRSPAEHRLAQFAGARVRMASLVVGLEDRKPVEIVLRNFSILTFDERGRFDLAAFEKPQRARLEMLHTRAFGTSSGGSTTVIEAESKFSDRGGRWEPSRALARSIDRAALDLTKCRRL
jgi:hypothetical protein